MRRLAIALAALCLQGCFHEPAPPAPPPVALVPSAAPAASAPAPEPDEAGVVRCGAADRPKPIGWLEPRPGRQPVDRALLGLINRQADIKLPPFVILTPEVPRLAGAPAPQVTRGLVGEANPEGCARQAQRSDEGPIELSIEMAPTGEPLKVRSSRGPSPSEYVHCLMETACHLKASAEASGKTIALPFALKIAAPVPVGVSVAGGVRPEVRWAAPKDSLGHEQKQDLVASRLVTRVQARVEGCMKGWGWPTRQPLLLEVKLSPAKDEGQRPGVRMDIESVSFEAPVPPELESLRKCLISSLSQTSLGLFTSGDVKPRAEHLELSLLTNKP